MCSPRVRVLFYALWALTATVSAVTPGTIDSEFTASANNTVSSLALQPDGQIVAGGYFTAIGSVTRNHIARFLPDGELDGTFDPNANANVSYMAVAGGGALILADLFTTLQPNGASNATTRNYLAEVLGFDGIFSENGGLVPSFNPKVNGVVRCLALQPDGKIIIGGEFTTVGQATHYHLARLSADGGVDAGFNPALDDYPISLVLQLDGKILLGGPFTEVNGESHYHLARLEADGSLDRTFNAYTDGNPLCMAIQADGKIVMGGGFTTVNGAAHTRVARLEADGEIDGSFNPDVNDDVFTMALQTDGRILIGGYMTMVGTTNRNKIARLNGDGSLDNDFNPDANAWVYNITVQADGKILLGGGFTAVGGASHYFLARLHNDPATQSLSVLNTGRVQWLRGGASPEAQQVTFDLAVGGYTWQPLGNGIRVAGGWQLAGLSLPASGQIRARARTLNGIFGQTSGLVESFQNYTGANSPLSVAASGASAITAMTATLNFTVNTGNLPTHLSVFVDGSAVSSLTLAAGTSPVAVPVPVTGLVPASNHAFYAQASNTVESAQSGTVQFHTPTPTYTVTPSAGAHGTISPAVPQTVILQGNASFEAAPASGYMVDQWLVNGTVAQTGGTAFTLKTVVANATLRVTFKAIPPVIYTVLPKADAHGAISPVTAQMVESGGSLTFTAAPAGGYMVDQWLVNGSRAQTGGNSYVLSGVTENATVQVTFQTLVYAVTPSAGPNGSLSPGSATTVPPGGSITFTAAPDAGYQVDQWLVDGVPAQTGGAAFTLDNVTKAEAVMVAFRSLPTYLYSTTPPNKPHPTAAGFYASDGSLAGVIDFRRAAHHKIVGVDRLLLGTPAGKGAMELTFDETGRPLTLSTTDGLSLSFRYKHNGKIKVVGTDATGAHFKKKVPGFETSLPDAAAALMAVLPGLQSTDFSQSSAAGQPGGPRTHAFGGLSDAAMGRLIGTLTRVTNIALDVVAGGATSITGVGAVYFTAKIGLEALELFTFELGIPTPYLTGILAVADFAQGFPAAQELQAAYLGLEAAEPLEGLLPLIADTESIIADEFQKKHEKCTVTAYALLNGAISPDGTFEVAYGTNVAFTATPDAGYEVLEWKLDGVVAQTGNRTYILGKIIKGHGVTVSFKPAVFTVTPKAEAHGSIVPASVQKVAYGKDLPFTAVPDSGYSVDQWLVNGTAAQSGGNAFTLRKIVADSIVQVTFSPGAILVTPKAGTHGSIAPASVQKVAYGKGLTFAAAPATGYAVDQWLVNGKVAQSGGNSFALKNVTTASTVQVTFRSLTVTLTLIAGPNGTISSNVGTTVPAGSDVEIDAHPADGYVVDEWFINDQPAQAGGYSYELNDLTTDTKVSVTFKNAPPSDFYYTTKLPVESTTIISAVTGAQVPATVQGTINFSYQQALNTYTIGANWNLASPGAGDVVYSNSNASKTFAGPPPASLDVFIQGVTYGPVKAQGTIQINLTQVGQTYTGSVKLQTPWTATYSFGPSQSGVAETTHSALTLK